jgi:signal transduction histidine kinase/DNA-directed RNA polymerase subunit N (RpoN/RPB10)
MMPLSNEEIQHVLAEKLITIEQLNKKLEIETSLEQVRVVALSMSKREDMIDICRTICQQLQLLNVKEIRNVQTAIIYQSKGTYLNYEYYAKHDKLLTTEVEFKNHKLQNEFANQMLKGAEELFTEHIEGVALKKWYQYQKTTNQFVDVYLEKASSLSYYFYSLGPVALGISTYAPLNEEEINLFKRFRNVFELAYRRFMDIEKAAAQAREAQIETALERVRSKSMAMHKSEELKEVIKIVYQQIRHLNIHLDHAGFVVDYTPKGDWTFWIADEQDIPSKITHPYFESVWANQFNEAKEKGTDFFATHLNFEEKNKFYKELLSYVPGLPEASKDFYLSCPGLAATTVLLENVGLYIENFSGTPYTEEENTTLIRFGKVFQQTYTRFLDLQKAEAQAKEAQIELALERVRARTMAMQQSDELREVVLTIYEQLQHLDFNAQACNIVIADKITGDREFWVAGFTKEMYPESYKVPYINHPYVNKQLDAWKHGEKYAVFEYAGKMKKDFDAVFFSATDFRNIPDDAKRMMIELPSVIFSTAFFNYGSLQALGKDALSTENADILKRFAKVFEQTYTRFLDLKKAEAQAREAQVELGLERVRARAMAMQKSEELAELVDTVFKELTKLHFTLDRCIIIIIDEKSASAKYWMANPESLTAASYHLQLKDVPYLIATLNGWKERKIKMVYDLKGDEKSATAEYILTKTELRLLPAKVKEGMKNTDRVFLNSSFNNFGGLQADTIEPLTEENLDILYRFAKVFDLTYTRFNDLKQAEHLAKQAQLDLENLMAEKKKTEEALTELKAAQSQLIQSEKMASLGELTAGIAHEIQNPLNFVNNFSEVSNELLDEMMEEVAKGNYEEVKAIVNDVKQNLEKINHHGKRADGIVKGMLQHSRSSSATKEPTDINKLADEYLRLAYHGLRAKDKSFNATLETAYDETIGNINIIPQDIGRVILNLITNAFYAAPLPPEGGFLALDYKHSPTVWVSTKKLGDKVIISVRDNGPGIPKKILDKIFQPFFTTKPTGQGTGLGLSLSYDIVKAHGGEIKINTKEGEGAEFIISLPYKTTE